MELMGIGLQMKKEKRSNERVQPELNSISIKNVVCVEVE